MSKIPPIGPERTAWLSVDASTATEDEVAEAFALLRQHRHVLLQRKRAENNSNLLPTNEEAAAFRKANDPLAGLELDLDL